MATLKNLVRERRIQRGWSQDELANRTGLSRTGIGAIEAGRLVPSTAAALALAHCFGCRVEDLFRLQGAGPPNTEWAWAPTAMPCRYWHAEVGGRVLAYPVEATPVGSPPHDGLYRDGSFHLRRQADPADTLVLACCDPAVGLLAAELARTAGIRLLAFSRSSEKALGLLAQGLVHAAGLHLARADDRNGNATAVRTRLGPGFRLLHVARWEEGIVFAPRSKISSIRSVLGSDLRWVGREPGSGARQCLDELRGDRPPPRRMALDHRGVVEAVRSGWADVGVCLRLTGEEAGLGFLGVREEAYDLCYPEHLAEDRRLRALVDVILSASFRALIDELPGYDGAETGAVS